MSSYYIYHDVPNYILQVTIIDTLLDEQVDQYIDEVYTYLEMAPPDIRVKFLVDVSKAGNMTSYGRKRFTQLNRDKRIGKSAVFGLSNSLRAIMKFILIATRRNNIRVFFTKEEANAWLLAD